MLRAGRRRMADVPRAQRFCVESTSTAWRWCSSAELRATNGSNIAWACINEVATERAGGGRRAEDAGQRGGEPFRAHSPALWYPALRLVLMFSDSAWPWMLRCGIGLPPSPPRPLGAARGEPG